MFLEAGPGEEEETNDDDDRDENLHLLTFRDVEESMSVFSGHDKINIRNCLQEFEEMAELCN